MVAAAVTTARIIPKTVRGGIPGGRPKMNTSTTSPIPAAVPSAIPPRRAPTKIHTNTTRSSSQSMPCLLLPAGSTSHCFRVQHGGNLLFGEELLLPHQLNDALAGLQRFRSKFCGLVVAQQGIQSSDNADAVFHVFAAYVSVHRDSFDAKPS